MKFWVWHLIVTPKCEMLFAFPIFLKVANGSVRNVSHSFGHLNSWSPVSGSFRKLSRSLRAAGNVSLLADFEIQSLVPLPVYSVCLIHVLEM